MKDMMKKNLTRGMAVVLAAALVIPMTLQFRDASLKATDEDAAAEAPVVAEAPQVVVEEVYVPAPEPIPEPVPEPAPAAEPEAEETPAAESAQESEDKQPAESADAKTCSCDAAEGEPHKPGCPLYQPAQEEKTDVTEDPEKTETEETEEAEDPEKEPEEIEEIECTCGAAEGEPHAEDCPMAQIPEEEPEEEPEAEVTITYTAGEGGTVSLTSETLKEESEDPQGSTAVANEGYHFVNWTKGDEEVTTEETLIPAKADGKNEATEYVAHFEKDEEAEEEASLQVTVSSDLDGVTKIKKGTVMHLTAHVEGSGNRELKYQWQCSTDGGASWSDIAGATGSQFGVALDESNVRNLWRVSVSTVD